MPCLFMWLKLTSESLIPITPENEQIYVSVIIFLVLLFSYLCSQPVPRWHVLGKIWILRLFAVSRRTQFASIITTIYDNLFPIDSYEQCDLEHEYKKEIILQLELTALFSWQKVLYIKQNLFWLMSLTKIQCFKDWLNLFPLNSTQTPNVIDVLSASSEWASLLSLNHYVTVA